MVEKAKSEKILVHLEVDGDIITLEPIDMGEAHQHHAYKDDIVFYSGGDTVNKEHAFALYSYSIRLTRHKFDEEKKMEFKL